MNVPSNHIDALFAEWDKPDSPGCSLAVVHEGQIVYKNAYGISDLENNVPLTPESVFYIASVSKQFTAACILFLAHQNAVTLDDDVRTHIPELPEYEAPITVRHLIHHTSGLRDFLGLLSLSGTSIMEDTFDNRDAVSVICRQKALNFAPGDEHLYSNSGYKLMAEIVHRVSGQTLRAFAQKHILNPLGMQSSHFDDDHTEHVENRVVSYQPDGKGFAPFPKNFDIVGSGGLLSTVEDLFLWDQNFYNNTLQHPDLIDQLLTAGQLNNGDTLAYACGLILGDYKGLQTVSHSGGMLGFSAHLLRFPGERFTVICLGNLSTLNVGGLCRKVADLYLPDRFKLDVYVGDYHSDELDCTYTLASEAGNLFFKHAHASEDPLEPTGKDRFQVNGNRIRFTRNDRQEITEFTVSTDRVRNLRFEKQ